MLSQDPPMYAVLELVSIDSKIAKVEFFREDERSYNAVGGRTM